MLHATTFLAIALVASTDAGSWSLKGPAFGHKTFIQKARPVLQKAVPGLRSPIPDVLFHPSAAQLGLHETLDSYSVPEVHAPLVIPSDSYGAPPEIPIAAAPAKTYGVPAPAPTYSTPPVEVIQSVAPIQALSAIDKYGPCGVGLERTLYGKCVQPKVTKDLFLYKAPPYSVPYKKAHYDHKPKVHYNLVFLQAPSYHDEQHKPIVVPPPKQQTLVYLLSKRPTGYAQDVIEVPLEPTKPEVFFVDYKDGDNPVLPGGIDLNTALSQSAIPQKTSFPLAHSPVAPPSVVVESDEVPVAPPVLSSGYGVPQGPPITSDFHGASLGSTYGDSPLLGQQKLFIRSVTPFDYEGSFKLTESGMMTSESGKSEIIPGDQVIFE